MSDLPTPRRGILDLIEVIGNRLPDPAALFLIGWIVVVIMSWIAVQTDWRVTERLPVRMTETVVDPDTGEAVERPVLDDEGNPRVEWRATLDDDGGPVVQRPANLLTRDGVFWMFDNLVPNFVGFAPLGVVLVGMLGIGVAERTGLIGAILKSFMLVVPGRLLTPAMVFIGVMSSMTLDAGYVVLPPLAAALYKAVGRSPLAGLAAVFAGVSAGFNANLFITGLEPMLAEMSTIGGQVIDPDYAMNPACNWYFMVTSTFVITLAGWATTSWFVERRLRTKSPEDGGPTVPTADDLEVQRLTREEKDGLVVALGAAVIVLGILAALIFIPGAPLHAKGEGERFGRWVEAIVPMLFLIFIVPGIAYGAKLKTIRNDQDVAKLLMDSMSAMAPIIVLAFFAAQFINAFDESNLGTMLAMAGGQALGQAEMSPMLLVVVFILVTMVFNLFVGSMSAKYLMFAPIFVPMFMMVGISPELTQAAYRIGDSVSNIITPLNAYLVIILVFMQQYVPKGGIGTLISTMMPYTIVFLIVWIVLLMVWMGLGLPLGPDGPLTYDILGATG